MSKEHYLIAFLKIISKMMRPIMLTEYFPQIVGIAGAQITFIIYA